MTKKIEYKCNLCNDQIMDDKGGTAIYWMSSPGGVDKKWRQKITFKSIKDAEHHLCNNCVVDIVEASKPTGF